MLVAAFALALACRVAGQVALGAYLHPEEWEYEVIASNVLNGHGYAYPAAGTTYVASTASPLYVWLAVVVYTLTAHSQVALLLVQAVIGAAAAALCAWLGLRLYGAVAGWVAGLLAATHPALVVYAAKLHSLTLDAFVVCLVIAAFVALPRRPRVRQMALLGGLIGLAALTRSTVLLLVPAGLIWSWRFRGVRPVSGTGAALVAAALVVFAPWSIRNSLLLGQPILVSSESTEWLWRGNNPNATGSTWTSDGRTMFEAADPAFQQRVIAADEAGRIGIYRDAAVTFIRGNPGRAVALYGAKLAAFWWTSPSTGLAYPGWWTRAYSAYYLVLAACAAVGLVAGLRAARSRDGVLLIVATLALVSLGQSVFYVEGRHRWEVESLLLVLAAGGVRAISYQLSAISYQQATQTGDVSPISYRRSAGMASRRGRRSGQRPS